mmetsp:Transcript_3946/g.8917  ORF Transcript_3946/g.8917 Transcript_3946/m.8917 type:complete len:266 (+) Transcript_3946:322-1119(+)
MVYTCPLTRTGRRKGSLLLSTSRRNARKKLSSQSTDTASTKTTCSACSTSQTPSGFSPYRARTNRHPRSRTRQPKTSSRGSWMHEDAISSQHDTAIRRKSSGTTQRQLERRNPCTNAKTGRSRSCSGRPREPASPPCTVKALHFGVGLSLSGCRGLHTPTRDSSTSAPTKSTSCASACRSRRTRGSLRRRALASSTCEQERRCEPSQDLRRTTERPHQVASPPGPYSGGPGVRNASSPRWERTACPCTSARRSACATRSRTLPRL